MYWPLDPETTPKPRSPHLCTHLLASPMRTLFAALREGRIVVHDGLRYSCLQYESADEYWMRITAMSTSGGEESKKLVEDLGVIRTTLPLEKLQDIIRYTIVLLLHQVTQ